MFFRIFKQLCQLGEYRVHPKYTPQKLQTRFENGWLNILCLSWWDGEKALFIQNLKYETGKLVPGEMPFMLVK
jgi:hypothetical protein